MTPNDNELNAELEDKIYPANNEHGLGNYSKKFMLAFHILIGSNAWETQLQDKCCFKRHVSQ